MPDFAPFVLPVVLSTLTFGAFAPTATAERVEVGQNVHARQTVTLQILGMVTPDCPERVRAAAESIDGVLSAEGDLASKTATIEFRADKVSIEQIRHAIKTKAGFDSRILEADGIK